MFFHFCLRLNGIEKFIGSADEYSSAILFAEIVHLTNYHRLNGIDTPA